MLVYETRISTKIILEKIWINGFYKISWSMSISKTLMNLLNSFKMSKYYWHGISELKLLMQNAAMMTEIRPQNYSTFFWTELVFENFTINLCLWSSRSSILPLTLKSIFCPALRTLNFLWDKVFSSTHIFETIQPNRLQYFLLSVGFE